MYDKKLTNPKDAIGSSKLPLHLVPDILEACAATALLEGALKYGAHNWRAAGVRSSIYYSALKRHLKKWWNGQDRDPKTRVHHLDNAIACLAILRDAELAGKLNDDRPPSVPMDVFIDEQVELVAHLKELFKDENPRHWSIADNAEIAGATDLTDAQRSGYAEAAEQMGWPVLSFPNQRDYDKHPYGSPPALFTPACDTTSGPCRCGACH